MVIMKKYTITAKELSIILGIQRSTMYYIMYPEKKEALAIKKAQKENRSSVNQKYPQTKINYEKELRLIKIDIDHFVNEHKISKSFRFEGESFLDRMIISFDADEYPNLLSTKELKELTNLSTYQIKKIRELNLVKYSIIENTTYPIYSKNRYQYMYDKSSLLNYLNSINHTLKPVIKYNITKQFYSAKEFRDYLKEEHGIETSISTIYRRILVTKEIPAIRIGSMLKIPILELKRLDFSTIFST